MNTKTLFLLNSLFVNLFVFSQAPEKYNEYIDEADNLYDEQKFKESAAFYSKAFFEWGGSGYIIDFYNAACTYSLAKEADSAFKYLNIAIVYGKETDMTDFNHDKDFDFIRADKRWKKSMKKIKANKKVFEKDLDKKLVKILDRIYETDQGLRLDLDSVEAKYGRESDELSVHWEKISYQDSLNLIEVSKILDERGWLGPKIVGARGNSTLFLVIQHSPLAIQEKYLPMMKEAVLNGNAYGHDLALLLDRVEMRNSRKQIYGSQIMIDEDGESYVFPILEPEKVNERRASVNLGPIESYTKYFDLEWDLEKHKERVKKWEEDQNAKE